MHNNQLSIFTLFIFSIAFQMNAQENTESVPCEADFVTIAILAKDKAHTLPLYLSCIENQTWPTEKTYLYIRTNNNNDNTIQVLLDWVERVWERYAGVYFDDSDVPEPVHKYAQHEWNGERFKVLGRIRQESVNFAKEYNTHYFVADCDNFIRPNTIESLVNAHLPIVAPMLHTGDSLYSNYHAAVDKNGYLADSPYYNALWAQEIKGFIQVPVVHCTYFIRNEVLDKITYDDNSWRYEYVIFSDSARKNGVPQYLDTRDVYGRITFSETFEHLLREPWLFEFATTSRSGLLSNYSK